MSRKKLLTYSLVLIGYSLLYYILRLPTAPLELAYYDDAEALYHTLNILQGNIPHRDDYNHHFSGYILEFVAAAKLFGFSESLIRQTAFLNQVLVGFGVFLILSLECERVVSILGGALAIAAREPWILGFFPQQQINLLWVYSLYFSLVFLRRMRPHFLYGSGILAGLAFTFDQRAGALALIPVATYFTWRRDRSLKVFFYLLCSLALPATAALAYLAYHDALIALYEQTIRFPTQYRVGSRSMIELLAIGLEAHKYLWEKTPVLLGLAVTGLISSIRRTRGLTPHGETFQMLLVTMIPLLVMPFFGGRDQDYYTLTWLPYLAIMAGLGSRVFRWTRHTIFLVVLATPLFLSVCTSLANANWAGDKPLSDGGKEVAAYLESHMDQDDTVFVWGYRLDIYVRLKRLSPYPFASRIMIHPDQAIKDPAARLLHIDPEYQKRFARFFRNDPPDYVVVFFRKEYENLSSPSQELVTEMLQQRYALEWEIEKKDFLDENCLFKVYRLRE